MSGSLFEQGRAALELTGPTAPLYHDAQQQLLGKLSVVGLEVDESIMHAKIANANTRLITQFAQTLPQPKQSTFNPGDRSVDYERYRYDFYTEEPRIACGILATTVWMRDFFGGHQVFFPPRYIIGSRSHDKKWTDIMLLNTYTSGEDKPWGAVVTVKSKEFAQAQHKASTFTAEKVAAMVDESTECLRVNAATATAITVGDHPHPFNEKRMRLKLGQKRLSGGITNERLEAFQVPQHLNRLAEIFDATEALAGLYEARLQLDTRTTREKLLGE